MFRVATLRSIVFLSFIFSGIYTYAQPTLPEITGAMDKGVNVLSWVCQYDGIKSIAVQRSSDSVFNYATVGYVKDTKKGVQAFIDGHPAPGKNWYRLYIVFNSDLTWQSNRFKIEVDSAAIMNARVLPPNDSLQKLASNVKIEVKPATTTNPVTNSGTSAPGTVPEAAPAAPRLVLEIPDAAADENGFAYVKSQYVFTNPFTGHVNVALPEYRRYQYSIDFYDKRNRKVLEVGRVTEPEMIIDKRNFQRKGIYKFELKQNRRVMETGYITIY